jgi:deoxycytidylate deaminase
VKKGAQSNPSFAYHRRERGIAGSAGGDVTGNCNDVPAPGGGLYWEGDGRGDHREHKRGEDSNDRQKEQIVKAAVDQFQQLAPAESRGAEVLSAVEMAVTTAIGDITEFGRSVHAEMDAITTCARTGVPIAGATLFTTTFPCHTCTRHIVAAGIRRVVYIEPYPKSQAGVLHGDAICLAPCNEPDNQKKIPFEPFVGIGPRRFFDLFSLKLSAGYRVERKVHGGVIDWKLETHAKPRVPMATTSYIQREEYISKTIVATYKEKSSQSGGSGAESQDRRGVLEADGKNRGPSREVASVEGRREVNQGERTGTGDGGHGSLFNK